MHKMGYVMQALFSNMMSKNSLGVIFQAHYYYQGYTYMILCTGLLWMLHANTLNKFPVTVLMCHLIARACELRIYIITKRIQTI
jgi:hypothetical protein